MTLDDAKKGGLVSTLVKKTSQIEEWIRAHKALYHPSKDSVAVNGGWNEVYDTWTRATNNTITVPSGAASIYKKGMGIRWKQGGGYKYASIIVVADTLLTVTGGTDYVVSAGTPITDVAWTLTPETAIGFPAKFTCAAPTWDTATIDNGTGGQQPTAGNSSFLVLGNRIKLSVKLGSSGVFKNTAGQSLTISALPATLPNTTMSFLSTVGNGISANVVAVYVASASSFTAYCATSIADNASIANSSIQIEYEY